MKMINNFFLFILFFCFLDVKSQCNGSFQLCDKKYNEVAFLTTHNAFNSSEDNFGDLIPTEINFRRGFQA